MQFVNSQPKLRAVVSLSAGISNLKSSRIDFTKQLGLKPRPSRTAFNFLDVELR